MKKSKILIFVLALILVVTGCGEKAPEKEDRVAKAIEKMNGLNNYHISITMDMSFAEGGITSSTTLNVDEDYDVKNHTDYIFMSSSLGEQQMEEESYTQTKDGKTTSYSSSDSENWIKAVYEDEVLAPSADFNSISKVKDAKVVKEENGVTTYENTLDQETAKQILKDMDITEESAEFEKGSIKFIIDKDGYITDYVLSTTLKQQGQTMTIRMNVKFSKFNNVGDVIIPQEIIDTAKEF